MKKIFYILASAIVALGAVACENEGLENINPENNGNGEGLTITATIDEATKVLFDGFTAKSWESGDYVTIGGYTFNYVPAEGLFRCEDEAAKALIGTEQLATANALNSANGIKGSSFVATETVEIQPGVNISFKLSSALLKYTTSEEVAFTGTALSGAFTDATQAGSVKYIAVNTGDEVTLSYSVGGVQCKSLTKNFEPGKIYNLGTLTAPDYLIKGINGDWDKGIGMFKEGDWYVARNVNVTKKSEFKFNSGDIWTANGGTVVINTAYSVTKGQGNNSTIAVGKYDFYLNTAVNTFYIMAPGTTKYDNGWIFVGSNIEGAGNWDVNAKDPSLYWDIIEQQNYGIITVKAGAEFKFVKEGSNWGEQYGAFSGSQEISLDSAKPTNLNADGGSANLKLSTAGTYKVYLDFGGKKVWAVLQQ